ncbi:MAG TPA: hypothetical protein VHI13_13175 [Candidatus Kapabacteria bacterium]|nr:hypothetical protein [Candidatus Kapabacteria bacterium]
MRIPIDGRQRFQTKPDTDSDHAAPVSDPSPVQGVMRIISEHAASTLAAAHGSQPGTPMGSPSFFVFPEWCVPGPRIVPEESMKVPDVSVTGPSIVPACMHHGAIARRPSTGMQGV